MIRRIGMVFFAGILVTISGCTAPASSPSALADHGATIGATESPRPPSCAAHVVAGDSANGTAVCVTLGSDLTVLLHTMAGSGWSTPEVTGNALGPARPLPTPFGSVGWSFLAAAVGTAEFSTSRPVCPSAGSAAVRCRSVVGYLLHVEVR
jgi:hypothetical protein